MSTIYFNGALAITSFTVQEWKNGSWVHINDLQLEHKYRFVVTVLNNAGDPTKPDLTSLKVTDLLNPVFFFMPPRGKVIVFGRIKVSICCSPGGLNAYRFYPTSDFSGAWTPAGSAQSTQPLRRGDSTKLFVHFKWMTVPFFPSGPWPGSYMPQVTLNAREMTVSQLPDGPMANLQPFI